MPQINTVATPSTNMAAIENAVTQEQWANLRAKSRQQLPVSYQGAGLPDVLLGYQQALFPFIEAHDVGIIEKSRRIGLTWGVGSKAVLYSAASITSGGMNTYYIGYNLEMARDFIDVCAMWARAFNQVVSDVEDYVFEEEDENGEKHSIKSFRITFASGFVIVALSSRPRSLRGKQGFIILDEAAFHEDLPGLMKAAVAMLIWGAKVLVISTHDGDDNHFNVLCEEVRKGKSPNGLMKITFDDALADGLYKRICLVKGKVWSAEAETTWRDKIYAYYGEDADEELDVIPRAGSQSFLPPALIARQQRDGIDVVEWEQTTEFAALPDYVREAEAIAFCEERLAPYFTDLPRDLPGYFGMDFARSGDLSCIWPAILQPNMQRKPIVLVEMWNIPFEEQRIVLWYMLRRMPLLVAGEMDATGNGAWLAERTAQEFGWEKITQVKITNEWYAQVMPRFKAGFEDGSILTPNNLNVYNDHRSIRLVKGVPVIVRESAKKAKGEEAKGGTSKKKRHGDSAIADLLCYMASLRDLGVYEYKTAQIQTQQNPDYIDQNTSHRTYCRFAKGAF